MAEDSAEWVITAGWGDLGESVGAEPDMPSIGIVVVPGVVAAGLAFPVVSGTQQHQILQRRVPSGPPGPDVMDFAVCGAPVTTREDTAPVAGDDRRAQVVIDKAFRAAHELVKFSV